MQNTEIFSTHDYTLFSLLNENRLIQEGKVNRYVKSIQEIGYIISNPIIVTRTFVIIDGQHRFRACQKLGLPIYYAFTNVEPVKAMLLLNANQDVWRLQDYILSYAKQGVECYRVLNEFETTYKLGISNSIVICCPNVSNRAKNIRKGIVFTHNQNAHHIAAFILKCNILPFYKTAKFVSAVVVLYNKANNEEIERVYSNIQSLQQQPTISHYLRVFENIINKRKRNNLTFLS